MTDYDALCRRLREWGEIVTSAPPARLQTDAADAIAALVARVKELEAEVKRLDGLVDAYVERAR